VRRRLAAVAATVVVVLLLAAPAALAATAAVTSPSDTVRGPVDLKVTVTKESRLEPISRVRARLQRNGDHVGERIDLVCQERCGNDHDSEVWGPRDDKRLDPATGAPFEVGGPLANGEYVVQIRVDRDRFLDPIETTDRIRLAAPPTAPGDVTAERDGGTVAVSWSASPEPDITGYRVERREGDDWKDLATTSETGHADEPGPGSHAYRVVALRDDGRGGTLEKASSSTEVEIPEPDAGNGDGNGNGNGDGSGDGGSGNGGGSGDGNGGGSDDGGGDDGQDGADAGDDESSASSSGRSPRSSSPARAPSLGSDRSGSIPSVFGRDPASADPDAFSEQLDFGDPADGDDDVVLSTRDGFRGTVDRILDAERVATPIAFGLVLTATGLHLWRWLRVPAL
jgi:hypothetical protein